MKKFILAASLALFGIGASFAQTAQPAQQKTKTANKEMVKTHAIETAHKTKAVAGDVAKAPTSHVTKATAAHKKQTTAVAQQPANATVSTGTHLKKDGTTDKRYKQHAQHLKKDGSADKRFKNNKQ